MMVGIPSTSLRARYGSVGMRLRAGSPARRGRPKPTNTAQRQLIHLVEEARDLCLCECEILDHSSSILVVI